MFKNKKDKLNEANESNNEMVEEVNTTEAGTENDSEASKENWDAKNPVEGTLAVRKKTKAWLIIFTIISVCEAVSIFLCSYNYDRGYYSVKNIATIVVGALVLILLLVKGPKKVVGKSLIVSLILTIIPFIGERIYAAKTHKLFFDRVITGGGDFMLHKGIFWNMGELVPLTNVEGYTAQLFLKINFASTGLIFVVLCVLFIFIFALNDKEMVNGKADK